MNNCYSLTIAIVAGEISGDILGAGLIREIKTCVPRARFIGVAGPLMKEAGCESWYEIEEFSLIGISAVLMRFKRLLHILTDLTYRFTKLEPDVFVGVDMPDFNISLERNLKKRGIKTIHYVSPSIWAWRQKRVFKIGNATNLILTLLPFEKEFYDRWNIPCRFVGHAMADAIPLNPDKKAARKILGISNKSRCLAILPGSRNTEIELLTAIFLKTAKILYNVYSDLEIIVPMVNLKDQEQFENIKKKVMPDLCVRFLTGKSREVMVASDAALLASGTAALECMLAKCLMVIGYRMKPFDFWLAKRLVKTNYISLPNLLAGYELVKELIQDRCHPKALADALFPLLDKNRTNYQLYNNIFRKLHQQIRCNADKKAADAVLELVNAKGCSSNMRVV